MKQTAHKGHTSKHAGTAKHTQGKGKHHPAKAHKAQTHHHAAQKQHAHTAAKGPKVAKPRKLAGGAGVLADVACCPVLALATSLRLSGGVCGADDVLALYGRLTNDADAGAPILAALEAAAEYGLAGVRPLWFGERPLDHLPLPFGQRLGRVEDPDLGEVDHGLSEGAAIGERLVHGLILGMELPGPHAVLAETGRWWSWGQPFLPAAFPGAVVEEAWAVVWP